jgi:hypothetical protein
VNRCTPHYVFFAHSFWTADGATSEKPRLPDRSESSPTAALNNGLDLTTPASVTANTVYSRHQPLPIGVHSDVYPVSCPSTPLPTYETTTQRWSIASTGLISSQDCIGDVDNNPVPEEAYSSPIEGLTTHISNKKQEGQEFINSDLATQLDELWSLSGANYSGPVDPLALQVPELPGSLPSSLPATRPHTSSSSRPTFSTTLDSAPPCDRTMSDPLMEGRRSVSHQARAAPDSKTMDRRMRNQKDFMELLDSFAPSERRQEAQPTRGNYSSFGPHSLTSHELLQNDCP